MLIVSQLAGCLLFLRPLAGLGVPIVAVSFQEPNAVVPAVDTDSARIDPPVFARRVLATADIVLKRHVDPPTRQAMIVAAVKSLYAKAQLATPIGIGRRTSLAASDDELRKLLEEAWTSAPTGPPRQVEVPVGDKLLRLTVRGDVADRIENSGAKGDGGVTPDHVVPVPHTQISSLWRWRQLQELPEPPAGGAEVAPADPQLAKALEILRAALDVAEPD